MNFVKTKQTLLSSLGTVEIGALPETFWPKIGINGMAVATLSGTPVYYGISTGGKVNLRVTKDIDINNSLYVSLVYPGL